MRHKLCNEVSTEAPKTHITWFCNSITNSHDDENVTSFTLDCHEFATIMSISNKTLSNLSLLPSNESDENSMRQGMQIMIT